MLWSMGSGAGQPREGRKRSGEGAHRKWCRDDAREHNKDRPPTHSERNLDSSVLAWRIPGTAEPGGLLSMGSYRVGHD